MDVIKLEQPNLQKEAMNLAKQVFLQFDAPDYSKDGVTGVVTYIDEEAPIQAENGELVIYGCFEGQTLCGMCAVREYEHISLLFVKGSCHRKGIATALVKKAAFSAKLHGLKHISVHSSPFATGFYHKCGFVDTADEQLEDNIRYTPMIKSVLDNI